MKSEFLSAGTGAAVLQGQEQVFPHAAREARRSGRLPPHHHVHQEGDFLFKTTLSSFLRVLDRSLVAKMGFGSQRKVG